MEIQQESNKICLIGYGYWGKIIHKNLNKLNHMDITIIDLVLDNFHLLDDTYDSYFIITPFTTHYDVLMKISEFKNKKIWCEKPLVESTEKAISIYQKMELNNNKLFVDWVYTFNPIVNKIKTLIENKKIKQVILNRTNDGPKRFDTNSIYDLSSHDLSILYHIFDVNSLNLTWNEFSVKSNEEVGSNISWHYKDGLQVIINSSWQHKTKNRVSLFITEDDEIIVFDDIKKTLVTIEGIENYSEVISPLESAIQYFIENTSFEENKNLTLKITKDLENAIQ
jgi:predicted dehydrogenase